MPTQTVIVAEDDRVTSDILQFNLARRGINAVVCHDGEAAWQQLLDREAALVLTDHQMPKLSGVELCERIRNHGDYADLPLLLCSGKGLELDHHYLKEMLRIQHVFFKPFSPRAVAQKIEEILQCSAAPAKDLVMKEEYPRTV